MLTTQLIDDHDVDVNINIFYGLMNTVYGHVDAASNSSYHIVDL